MADELQSIRARLGSYFDTSTSIKNQCAVNAMCLAISAVRMNWGVTRIDLVVSDNRITLTHDGPGLPIDRSRDGVPEAERLMTKLHSCHKHPGHAGLESLICRSGLAAVNAISTSARLVTGNGAGASVQKYSIGKPVGPFAKADATIQGTRLDFALDKRWANDEFDLSLIEMRVRSLGVDFDSVALTFKDS